MISEEALRKLMEEVATMRQRISRLERVEPGARLPRGEIVNSANQSIANLTTTVITFNTVNEDTSGFYSGGSPNRLTVPTGFAGLYVVYGAIRWAANATGVRVAIITANGTTDLINQGYQTPNSATIACNTSVCRVYRFADGDYIELKGIQESGGNLNSLTTVPRAPLLGMVRLCK